MQPHFLFVQGVYNWNLRKLYCFSHEKCINSIRGYQQVNPNPAWLTFFISNINALRTIQITQYLLWSLFNNSCSLAGDVTLNCMPFNPLKTNELFILMWPQRARAFRTHTRTHARAYKITQKTHQPDTRFHSRICSKTSQMCLDIFITKKMLLTSTPEAAEKLYPSWQVSLPDLVPTLDMR